MTLTSTLRSTPKAAATLKPLTEEGQDIIHRVNFSEDNLAIEALAGTGKTTVLTHIARAKPREDILYLAFNKDIVKEAEGKMPLNVTVKTFNGLGHGAWAKAQNMKLSLNPKKTTELLRERIKELKGDDLDEAWEQYFDIAQAVGMAKHMGYIPEGKFPDYKRLIERQGLSERVESKLSPLGWALVDSVLLDSIKTATAGTIDFDDQIYMSALFGGTFPRYSLILVDEDQDLSPSNHAMLWKYAKDRMVAVGDRWQSIYYFRGAVTGSVDKLKDKFRMTEMPLSISFRCPSEIVRAAQWRVPNLKWFKEGGLYAKPERFVPSDIPEGAAVICRNNAPLLRMAYNLLSDGRSVQIAGSEIGPKIIRLMEKVGDEGDSRDILLGKIQAWRADKLEKTNSPDTINDQADCMALFASWGQTLEQAVAYANKIFQSQGSIQLTTGHKAKGREWEVVYHLDRHLCRDNEQDQNLQYVITTRAKSELYEVNSNGHV